MMAKYNSFVDLGKAFEDFKNDQFFNYKGHLLQKSGEGVIYSGRYFANLGELNIYLEEFYEKWNEDIKKQNNG